MAVAYKWKPFSDLPDDPRSLTTGELEPLHRIWTEQRERLVETKLLDQFNRQLQREWAIETGIIEGIYTLDRGITRLLIERGIDASLIPHDASDRNPELVAAMIQDHAEVLEGLFAFIKGERDFTPGYIKELHAALLRHQQTITVVDQFGRLFDKSLERGAYKTVSNNPTRQNGALHEYCPPEHVASEMDRLVALHKEHVRKSVPPEVEAAWLHHVFTQIHPFEDGNGRVARVLATLVFIRAGWFPLVVTRDERTQYMDALEAADYGDLRSLVSLFVHTQKASVLKAHEAAHTLRPPGTVDEAVAAARDLLVSTGQIPPKEWTRAKQTARHLLNVAETRLKDVASKLHGEIASVRPEFVFQVGTGHGQFMEVIEVGKRLNYFVNLNDYHQWVQLSLSTTRKAKLVVSFHGVGTAFRGLLAASVFLLEENGPTCVACDDFFQINYEEDAAQAEARFRPWLEGSILRGLTLWRQQLARASE